MNRIPEYPPAVKTLALCYYALDKLAGRIVQVITGLEANPKSPTSSRISSKRGLSGYKSLGWGKFSKP